MPYRVAINGFGRIGRNYTRALVERGLDEQIEIVAINDLWDVAALAHLLEHDTAFGRAKFPVGVADGKIVINGKAIPILTEKDPSALPWKELEVDLVLECTGVFRTGDKAGAHLAAGAKKVLLSVPGKGIDGTFVLGVNDQEYDPAKHKIVSCASCTTNCAAPVIKVLHDAFGVDHGFLTTVHAYTNDQMVVDSPHKDLRRARAAAANIIPTSTGAAKAVGLVLPALEGKLDGVALRVPVEDGSITDFSIELTREATATEINAAMKAAAEGPLKGILEYTEKPIVSRDIIGNSHSSIFDASLTQAKGRTAKVFSWYDNEWGYSNRMIDLTVKFSAEG